MGEGGDSARDRGTIAEWQVKHSRLEPPELIGHGLMSH